MGLFGLRSGNDNPRIAVIVIDGLPYSVVEEQPGTFPNLTALGADGSAGPISGVVPPESSAVWPALTTGQNPGRTGVYGFQDREVGSYDVYVPMDRDVNATRVWDRVESAGRNATVLNVPVTFPPQRDVQRMVSGFLSPGVEKGAYPDEFRDYLQSIDYRVDVNAGLGHEDTAAFIEDAHETLDKRQEAFERYVEEDDWDLFFGVIMATDRVNHFLFRDYETGGEYAEEFLDFYRKVDRYIGELREALADDVTLVVASDHGFTTLDYEVNVNAWLRREGWLGYASSDPDQLTDISSDTRAYSLVPGRVYLNLSGREPRGSVSRDEFESVRDALAENLRALEAPDGRPVVSRVLRREDAFRGDHENTAPDLVAVPNPGFDLKASFERDESPFIEYGARNGMHTLGNAALFVGDPDVRVDDAVVYDIAPTLLDLLDVEFDETAFDGVSLYGSARDRRSNDRREVVKPSDSHPGTTTTGRDRRTDPGPSGGSPERSEPVGGRPDPVETGARSGEAGRRPTNEPTEIPSPPDVSVTYDVLDKDAPIGKGGNADVIKVRASTAGGEVTLAVKEPRMSGTLHTDAVEQLLDEAETWGKLDDHDHVVEVVDYGSQPLPWIAMEYMDGGHLGDRAGEIDTLQALWTAIGVTKGVRHAHRRGVAHLDLKPENVLFRTVEDTWDVPKVADWGLSKHLLEGSKSVEGFSPGYAAPEQFSDDHGPTDHRTDVYQLGAVCYELFTGRPPFGGDTARAVYQVLHEEPDPPTEVADVPEAIDDILLTALTKDRTDRYDDVLYLRDGLQDLYRELSGSQH